MSIACCSSACHNVLLRFRAKQQVAASGVTQLRVTPAPENFPIGALTFDFFDPESTASLSRQRSARWVQLHQGTVGLGSCCNSWLLLAVLLKPAAAAARKVTVGTALADCCAAPSTVARPWPLKVLTPPKLPRSINRERGAACAGPSSISVQHCACQRLAFTFDARLLAPEVLAPPRRPPSCAQAHCGMRGAAQYHVVPSHLCMPKRIERVLPTPAITTNARKAR